MAKSFDPYHSWLGIRPEEQPANHYRLLGVREFEDNADAIENAADQRMAHLRTFQTGKRAELSQDLLNEVAVAKLCLLNPDKRDKYDKQLRAELDSEAAESAAADLKPGAGELPPVAPVIDVSAPPHPKPVRELPPKLPLIAGSAAVGLLLIVGIIVLASTFGSDENAESPKVAEDPWVDKTKAPPPPPPASANRPDGSNRKPLRPGKSEPRFLNRGKKWEGAWGNPKRPRRLFKPTRKPPPENPFESAPKPPPENPFESSAPGSKTIAQRPPGSGPPPVIFEKVEPGEGESPRRPSTRRPIPSPAVQRGVKKKLDELFSASAAKTAPQKLAIARKLREVADDSRGNPGERFVVLRMAMEMAAAGGDAALMLNTVDTLAAEYQLDALTGKGNMLSKYAAAANDRQRIEQLVEASLQVIEQAMGAGRFDVAMKAADAAYAGARRPGGKELRKETFDRREKLKEIFDVWKGAQKAQELLAVNPNDAQANLTLGRWLCFHRGDWRRGLPYLAKAGDVEVRIVARQELTAPKTTPADQLKLADAWWKLAGAKKGGEKFAAADRAAYWYNKSLAGLSGGLDKARAEMRLKEIARLGEPPAKRTPAPAAPTKKPVRKPQRKFLAPLAVAKAFGLQQPKWGIFGNEIQGQVTDIKKPENNPRTVKPLRTSSLEFGFRMRAKWFQAIHILVDDRRYSYVRGAVFGTVIHDGEKDNPRLGEKVLIPGGYSSLAVKLKDDTVSFYYNGVMEWSKKIPPGEDGKHTVVVGFGSSAELKLQKTIIAIRDVYMEWE